MKRTVARVWINYTVLPMELIPKKCPVAPSLAVKTWVISSWDLLRMARNGAKLRHRLLGASIGDAPAIGLPHILGLGEPANLTAEPKRQ